MRVDAYLPTWELVVEADGRRWHTRASDFEKDRARDNRLQAAGYKVCRFTYRDLTDDPNDCIQTLLSFNTG